MTQNFSYYAFISYSHKNAKCAEWIQRAIEHYKLPAIIWKEAQLPEGIFPFNESDLAHRHVYYRFEYRGFQHGKSSYADSADWCIWNMFGFRRRLVRVVQANSRGYPHKWEHAEYFNRPQIQDFMYDRDLRLREIRYGRYNGEGNEPHLDKRIELWDEGDVKNGLIKFFANKGQLGFAYGAAQTTFDPAGDTLSGKSEITQHLVQRDTETRYSNEKGNESICPDGYVGCRTCLRQSGAAGVP